MNGDLVGKGELRPPSSATAPQYLNGVISLVPKEQNPHQHQGGRHTL